MKSRYRAFTLLDTVLSLVLFSLLSVVLFSVFAQSASIYSLGSTRSDLQSELRNLSAILGRELTHSSFYSLAVHNTGTTITTPRDLKNPAQLSTVRRDALTCAGLVDPLAETSYAPASGSPLWDCHYVYFASNESPYGKLIRFRVAQPADERQFPLATFPGVINTFEASAVPRTIRVLTQRLVEFSVNPLIADQILVINLTLRGNQGRIANGKKSTAELLETQLTFKLENTWPRL